jgi:hypothetical protein
MRPTTSPSASRIARLLHHVVDHTGEVIVIARREFMLGAAAAGVLMQPRFGYAKASQPATNINFDVPAGACDCHTHIHGDPVKFPWFAGRTYTPETALPEEMTALHNALKIQRVVIVTPSVYGPTAGVPVDGGGFVVESRVGPVAIEEAVRAVVEMADDLARIVDAQCNGTAGGEGIVEGDVLETSE